jgi:hypothetical protein
MFEQLQSYLPSEWQRTVEFLGTPLWWIPEWQLSVLNLSWYADSVFGVVLKRFFLLMPILLLIVAVWSTVLSLYTLPFRSHRAKFLTIIALGWWDTGRGIWLYWTGLLRLVAVLVGWAWSLIVMSLRMVMVGVKAIVASPLSIFDSATSRYLKPGVPWIAVVLTLIWSGLEATIFSFTLMPTLTEVLADITGFLPNRLLVMPVLWFFLFFLIAGSFASIQVLSEAIQAKRVGQMIQMVLVEFFVAFFEVVFLYRELIDAITPWINQQSGGQIQMGLVSTLALGVFGWIGIRGMTWFLFGRFGTPSVLAIVSRQVPAGQEVAARAKSPFSAELWKGPIAALKSETAWFKDEARRGVELASLPVLQLLAVAVNFPVVAISSEPVFTFPLRDLDDVLADTPFPGVTRKKSGARSSGARGRSAGEPILGEVTT